MKNFCFVIMPFGDLFDEIYQKIYIPAIREVGLEPLRADDIYDNRSIIKDIKQSIQDATLILAEVTNRNPNVNYELGIAHALGKEVIIVTSNKEDVPSDYRHLRYLSYNRGGIGWDRELTDKLSTTLKTVLERLQISNNVVHPVGDGFYEASILTVHRHEAGGHYFYKLNGLLPLSELKVKFYISGESHWLADWKQNSPRFKTGDIVKFRVIGVSPIKNWDHVSNARNVNFQI